MTFNLTVEEKILFEQISTVYFCVFFLVYYSLIVYMSCPFKVVSVVNCLEI